jgi:hypothetical protein
MTWFIKITLPLDYYDTVLQFIKIELFWKFLLLMKCKAHNCALKVSTGTEAVIGAPWPASTPRSPPTPPPRWSGPRGVCFQGREQRSEEEQQGWEYQERGGEIGITLLNRCCWTGGFWYVGLCVLKWKFSSISLLIHHEYWFLGDLSPSLCLFSQSLIAFVDIFCFLIKLTKYHRSIVWKWKKSMKIT